MILKRTFVYPKSDNPPTIGIVGASLTSKWFEGTDKVQIVEVTLQNTHATRWLTLADTLQVTASSGDVDTVNTGTLKRLRPNQTAVVQVGVKNKAGRIAGANCTTILTAAWGGSYGTARTISSTISGKCGFGNYTADVASIAWHRAPQWFNDAKYGIFIHWGVYSVPAYGNVGVNESYAEWYALFTQFLG